MVSPMVSLAILIPALYAINAFYAFRKNLSIAKQSGLRYVVVPVSAYNRAWLISQRLVIPLLERLPQSWTESWLTFLGSEWIYTAGYESYQKLGTDTFLAVSSGRPLLWTCDPDVISQITTRRTDFPKPLEVYHILNVFGQNVVSTEGSRWRQHRKVVAPSFTERSNESNWAASISLAQDMLKSWVGERGEGTVQDPASDTLSLTLRVISWAGYGVRLRWSGGIESIPDRSKKSSQLEEASGRAKESKDNERPPGHALTYQDALQTVLHNIVSFMLIGPALLKRSPLKMHRVAWQAYDEWRRYMLEMFEQKQKEAREGRAQEGLDLIAALAKGAGEKGNIDSARSVAKSAGQGLSEEEILGNIFIISLAGHETTANTVYFSLVYLAMNPCSQARLQEDLDRIFGDKPITEWDYEEDFPKLFNGMPGAVMNETLRLVPPIIAIAKKTRAQPETLTVEGRTVTIPAHTFINLDSVGVQRHPKYWPADPSIIDDLNQFRPERWLLKDGASQQQNQQRGSNLPDEEELDYLRTAPEHANTNLFRPVRGTYIPFSDGPRACLGRKFAQVEITAVLATIMRQHSVELAVDDYATDDEIEQMAVGGEERRRVWLKARDRADWLLKYGMSSITSLQMRAGRVPFRIVRRGEERFGGFEERLKKTGAENGHVR
ncbi:MAG: hypothetical protein M1816_007542 [Peltula sp. TS41687]|nr:MAG: hypothetical protein M1816_007542 [Peltula sp. TS41687]